MQATIDKFIEEVKLKLAEASSKYNIKLDATNVQINCDVRGTTAGWAYSRGRTNHKLRFNTEAILKYNAEMIADTIPHEVAHLVCNTLPHLGYGHDFGWRRVCRALGGDDSRTHDYVLTPVRTCTRVEYVLDSGRVCEIGPKHHKAIQGGRTDFFMRNPKEFIRADQWVDYDYETAPTQAVAVPGLNIVRANVPDLSKLLSKRQMAAAIYQANSHLERRHVIALFMDKAEMTKAGASTYYQNFKSGKY